MTDRDTDYEDGAREGGDMWGPSSESPPLSPRSSSSHPSTLSPSCPAFFTSVCWRRTTTFFFIMIVTLLFLFVALETHLQIDNPCLLGRSGRWSIGMVHSKDKMPIDWRTSLLPVLSCTDVTDARNSYVADPFMLQRKEYDYGKDPLEMTSAAKGVMDEGEKALVRSVMKGPGNFESQAARLLTSPDASERTRNGKWFMFFEVLNTDTDEGDIGMAWSNDPITDGWHYQEIVLDEDYHLSYPFVFHWQGNYYMVPESHQNKSVRLYKASAADFPHKWTFVKTLLTGKPFIDPSPLFHNGVWYIFTYVKAKSSLLLYYSTSPNIEECEWRLHPASPLYTNNDKYARPGGRPFVYRMPVDEDGVADRILSRSSPNYGAATATSSGAFLKSDGRSKFEVEHAHKTPESRTEDVIIRFTQNDVEKYGHFLHMMRVKQLTPEKFEETEIFSIRPIPDFHWISQRTHHIDLHLITRYQDERNTLNVSTFSLSHHEADNNKELGGDPHIWMGVLDGNYHYNNLDQVKRLHYLGLFIAYVIVVLFFFPEMRHRLHRLSQHLTQTIRELLSRFDVYASSPSSPSKKSSKLPTTATATSSSTRNTSTSHPKPKYVRAHLPILLSRLLLGLLFILMLSPALYTFSSLTFTTRLPHPQRPLFVDTLSSSSATTRIAPPPALPSPPTASDSKQFVGVGPDAPPSSGVDSKVPCPITLVTALYDIGRGDPRMGQDKMQPWSNYLSYFSLVLQVNSCQVIHVDPTTVDFVVAQRGCRLQRTGGESAGDENGKGKGKGKGWRQERVENGFYENSYRVLVSDCTYPTEIIVTSLADMRAESQLLPKITEMLRKPGANKGVKRPQRVERRIPEYNMIMFSKLEWLHDAITRDPFHSKYFFWIDGGYGKGQYFREPEYSMARWPSVHLVEKYLPRDQYLIIKSREKLTHTNGFCDDPVHVARNHTTMLAGGFTGGSKSAVIKFLAEVRVTLARSFDIELMDDDQSVLFYTYCRRPDLVYLLRCVHTSAIAQTIGLYPKWRWGHFHCPVHMFLDNGRTVDDDFVVDTA